MSKIHEYRIIEIKNAFSTFMIRGIPELHVQTITGHLSALWKVRSEDAAGVEALEGSTKQLEGSLF